MEEATVRPSVFMVDGQSDIRFTRLERGRRRPPWRASQLGLGLLLLLLATGLAVEGWFLVQMHCRLGRLEPACRMEMQNPGNSWCKLEARKCPSPKPEKQKFGSLRKRVEVPPNQSGGTSHRGQLQPGTQWGPLLWQTQLGLAFLRGLSYRNGALVVSQAGYYYIYSKVQLGGVGCPQGLASSLPITHGLYKRTARYPKELELLVSRRSPCGRPTASRVWWDSSFLGGLVHLEAGEEVVVRVPDNRLVRLRDGTRSYFGTFMV